MLSRLRSFVRAVFRRRRFEDDMSAEMRFHVDAYAEDLERAGVPRDEARRRALAAFGGVHLTRDDARRARGLAPIEAVREIVSDLRQAGRSLARSRGFTTVVISCLGLAIGANTTVFTFVDSLLLRPVPLPASDRLVSIREVRRDALGSGSPTSYPNFLDWRIQAADIMDAVALQTTTVRASIGDESDRHTAGFVSWNLFPVLGVRPSIGRGFREDDDRVGAAPVVLLSHAFWQERYGAQTDAIGQALSIDGVSHTVIGVMPRDLSHMALRRVLQGSQVWMPIAAADRDHRRDARAVGVYARLHDGVTRDVASARLGTIARVLETTHPVENNGWTAAAEPLAFGFSSTTRSMLTTAMGAVVFVFLMVCVNVANLTLARMATRRREVATRLALGASRGRVVRQLFGESVILVLASLPLGVALAHLGRGAMIGGDADLAGSVAIDARVLVFTAGIAMLAGVLSGLIPAWLAVRRTLATTLAASTRGSTTSAPEHSRTSHALVVVEVALAVMLLVGASLFVRSFQNALAQDGGFDTSKILMVSIEPGADATSGIAEAQMEAVVDRLAALPSVAAIAAASSIPLRTAGVLATVTAEDPSPPPTPGVWISGVTPDFFDVLQVPVSRGRMFSADEGRSGAAVVVVNQTLARRLWPGEEPVGRRFRSTFGNSEWLTVVGVADDILSWNVSNRPVPTAYLPYVRVPVVEPKLFVRTMGEPAWLIAPVRDAVAAMVPAAQAIRVMTMTDVHHSALSRHLTLAWLFSILGGVALLLAAFGVYGVLAHVVAERTHEIGIRTALGADRRALIAHFMKQGLSMMLVGIAIGVAGAWGLSRVVRGALHGATLVDPAGVAIVAVVLTGVGAFATWLPASRAAAVDPVIAMRE